MKPGILPFLILGVLACTSDDPDITDQFTGNEGGCGSFFLYKFNDKGRRAIVVNGDRYELGLTTDWQDFSEKEGHLTVSIFKFSNGGRTENWFCDDVIDQGEATIKEELAADKFRVRIRIDEDSLVVDDISVMYKMSLEIEQATFEDEKIRNLLFENIFLGWLPG